MTIADQDIRELTARLGLTYYRQDWGIANAEAGLVGDFMQLCQTGDLTSPQQYAMCELVLASMNEALAHGMADAALLAQFKAFLALNLHGLASQVRYWASLTDGEEFPIAGLLGRELLAGA